jgi:hypothetical protein
MEKQEVIVDTCFLQKITSDGLFLDNVKRVLDELGFVPVVNKYVADQEFQLKRYMTELVNNGYIKVIQDAEIQA